jgi:tRNA threonylcarbamoyladenosine biosynthesis protein TsaB
MASPLPRILAIDTATGPCSVAIWDGQRIAAYVENTRPVMQSASLMPMVEAALKQTGMAYHDLNAMACTTGPGSFTGIRVGLASASGIAFAAGIAGVGYTTLEVLAFAALEHCKADTPSILAVLNAGKGEWYYQHYGLSPVKALAEPRLATWEYIVSITDKKALMAGNAPGKEFASCGITFPRADALAELAARTTHGSALRPFYIRDPDAKLPKTA